MISPRLFLEQYWPGQAIDAAQIAGYRREVGRPTWLEQIQAKLAAEGARDASDEEIEKCLSGCVCGELLVNLAKFLRDEGLEVIGRELVADQLALFNEGRPALLTEARP